MTLSLSDAIQKNYEMKYVTSKKKKDQGFGKKKKRHVGEDPIDVKKTVKKVVCTYKKQ